METFIDELKKEHRNILNMLLEAKMKGVHTMEGRNELIYAKDYLLLHLEKEDEELYPVLKKVSQDYPELKTLLDSFAGEMLEITSFCFEFFDRYSVRGGGIEFLSDFEKFSSLLDDRIHKEESILFPWYQKVM